MLLGESFIHKYTRYHQASGMAWTRTANNILPCSPDANVCCFQYWQFLIVVYTKCCWSTTWLHQKMWDCRTSGWWSCFSKFIFLKRKKDLFLLFSKCLWLLTVLKIDYFSFLIYIYEHINIYLLSAAYDRVPLSEILLGLAYSFLPFHKEVPFLLVQGASTSLSILA